MANKIWTIIDLIKWGEEWLQKKGVSESRLNIELMLCDLLDYSRLDLYTKFDQPLKQSELDKLREMVKKRGNRVPLQYIIGHVEFYGLRIKCDERALIPRPETEYLIELIKKKAKESPKRILDIGSGTGCIALSLAKLYPDAEIISIDISSGALELSEENRISNQINNVSFLELNILDELPKGKFDLIVSNPPYIADNEINDLEPELKENEPLEALSDYGDGYTFYRRFNDTFINMVNQSYLIALEYSDKQEEELMNMFRNNFNNIEISKDLNNTYRYMFISS